MINDNTSKARNINERISKKKSINFYLERNVISANKLIFILKKMWRCTLRYSKWVAVINLKDLFQRKELKFIKGPTNFFIVKFI